MIYRIRKTSYRDLTDYLDDIGIEFVPLGASRRTVDLETEELPLSVVSSLIGRGYMVYEQIALETWWCIRPEEGSYATVRQKLLHSQP